MPSSCCAYGCTNYYLKDRKVSYHTFPLKNKPLLREWLAAIKRLDFKPNKNTRICSDHFSNDCFIFHPISNRKFLKEGAIPTIFSFFKTKVVNVRKKTFYTIDGCNQPGKEVAKAAALSEETAVIPTFHAIRESLYAARKKSHLPNTSTNLTDQIWTGGKGIKTLLSKGTISTNEQKQPKSYATCKPLSLTDYATTVSVKDTLTTSDLQKPTTSNEQSVMYDLNSVNRENDMQSLANTENNTISNGADSSLSHSQVVIKQEILEIEENLEDSAFLLSSPSSSRNSTNNALDRLSSFIENLRCAEASNPQVEDVGAAWKGVKRPREDAPVACSFNDAPVACPFKDAPVAYSFKDAPVACLSQNGSEANQFKDRFDTFGVFVASKLGNLDQKSCANVQKAIVDLLFEAELGPLLLPKENTSSEEMNDSIINDLHKTVADASAFLQSLDLCSRDSSGHESDSERSSTLIQNPVFPEESESRFQSLKFHQNGGSRHDQNSLIACSSKYDPSQNFDEPPAIRPKDLFDAFGVFVVSKLRTMDPKLCSFVQKIISDLLYEAELGLFLTTEEKAIFQVKKDSIINKLHETVAGTLYTSGSL